jgi:hypothetical protein
MAYPTNYRNRQNGLSRHPADHLLMVREKDVKGIIRAFWNMPYDGDPLLEPETDGLTVGEVVLLRQITRAAVGDGQATDRILDRLIGKPMQVNANLNATGSYKDFLREIAVKEGLLDDNGRPRAEDAQLVE